VSPAISTGDGIWPTDDPDDGGDRREERSSCFPPSAARPAGSQPPARFPGGRQAVPFGPGRELRARRSCRASASPLRVSPFDRAWDLSTCPNRFAPRCSRARTSARRSCSAIGSNCCAPTPPTCRQRSSWRDGRIAAPCLNFFGHALSDHERTYLHGGRRLLPGSRWGGEAGRPPNVPTSSHSATGGSLTRLSAAAPSAQVRSFLRASG
jgi:hypothetical protein